MLFLIFATALATSPQAAAQSQPMKPQALFDLATEEASSNKCSEALAHFRQLLTLTSVQKNPTILGAVQSRMSTCLLRKGDEEEAEALLRSAEGKLPKGDPAFAADRQNVLITLGRLDMKNMQRRHAVTWFQKALNEAAEPLARMTALRAIAEAKMFDPDNGAFEAASEALKTAEALPDIPIQSRAALLSLKARTMLNHGQVADAYALLKSTLKDQGGLTQKINANKMVIRSDIAIAAILSGDRTRAKDYLAYTGAGRFGDLSFPPAANIAPPPCGGPNNISPDDMAIVELSIADDGAVSFAQTIYATRLGGMADEFTKAVLNWSWRSEDVAKINPLFRAFTRIEVRCSNASRGPDPKSALSSTWDQWVKSTGADLASLPEGDTRRLQTLTERLAATEGAPKIDTPIMIILLRELSNNPIVDPKDRLAYITRAADLASHIETPLQVRAMLDIETAFSQSNERKVRPLLRQILAKSDYANDGIIMAVLRLLTASPITREGYTTDARALLSAVIADPRIKQENPLRTAALVRLANFEASKGNTPAAQAAFEETGLDEAQCAIIDATPALRSTGISDSDFPMETLAWGFDGWVRTEFDIAADGKSLNHRAVAVYPPLVYRDAAVKAVRGVRYHQSYRPKGSLGCRAMNININFKVGR